MSKYIIVAVISLLSVGCRKPANNEGNPSVNIEPKQLIGVWKLKTVGGKDLAAINLQSYRVEFLENGEWKYSAAMAGSLSGMKMQGSGTWNIQSGNFDYTAEQNKGQSKITIQGNILTLSPDPVVLDPKNKAVTTYERVKEYMQRQ